MKTIALRIISGFIRERYQLICTQEDGESAVRDVRMICETAQYRGKDFVYLTESAETFQAMPAESVCFLLQSAFSAEPPAQGKPSRIILTEDSCVTVMEYLLDRILDYRSWYDACLEQVLRGSSLDEILEYAAQKLTNPIAMFDQTGVCLHQAGAFKGSIAGTLWEEVLQSGFTPTEYIQPDEQSQIMREIQNGTPLIVGTFQKDPAHRFMTIPISLHGKPFGAFGLIDLNEPFTAAQQAVVLDVRDIIQLALANRKSETVSRNMNYHIEKLIRGLSVDERSIRFYLKQRKWEREDAYYLLRFYVPNAAISEMQIQSFRHQLLSVMPLALIFHYEGAILAISRRKDFDPKDSAKCRKLESALGRVSLHCAVSAMFRNFMWLRLYHIQCQMAASLQKTGTRISFFDADYADMIVGLLSQQVDPKVLCHPEILCWQQSEKPLERTLIGNLKTYLLHGRSISDTAQSLGIHRNTLIYRLQKMEELLGISLADADETMLLYLLVSCMLCSREPA